MARYIDADEALKQIKTLQETDPATVGKKQFAEGFFCGLDEAEVILMRTPTADVEEVKHGEWKEPAGKLKRFKGRYVICSECNVMLPVITELPVYYYCPNCGDKKIACTKAEIERLRKIADNLRVANGEAYSSGFEIGKIMAIKEFAERLKATYPNRKDPRFTLDDCYTFEIIDNLVKEMTEGD